MQSYPVFVTDTRRHVLWIEADDQADAVRRAGNGTFERLDPESIASSDLEVVAPEDQWDWMTVYDGGDIYRGLMCDAHVETHQTHLWHVELAARKAACAAANHAGHQQAFASGLVDCTFCQVTLVEAPAPPDTHVYLVWSNDAGSWWGPNGHAYTGDLWSAGRYTRDEAVKACAMRTWSLGAPPPEVMVLAPEDGRPQFTVDDLRALPIVMRARVDAATAAAIADRDAKVPA